MILALPLLIIIVVVVMVMSRSDKSVDPGGFRDSFTILISAIGWILLAVGISGLIGAIPESGEIYRNSRIEIARSLSFLAIGLPLSLGLWRRVAASATPTSAAWNVSHFGVTSIALIVGLIGCSQVLVELVAGQVRPDSIGRAVAWGSLWLVGRWVERRHPTEGDLSVLSWSTISLIATMITGTVLLTEIFATAKENLSASTITGNYGGGSRLTSPAIYLLVSGTVWMLSWWADARKRPDSVLKRLYTLILGVSGGAVMAVSGLATILFVLAEWWIGSPEASSFAAQLEPVPAALAATVVGCISLLHHRRVAAMPDPSDRAARATLSAVGSIATAVGVACVVTAAAFRISGDVAGSGGTFDLALGGIIAALVGAALWWSQWSVMQRRAKADPTELDNPARRWLVTLMMGGSILAALPSVITLVYAAFNAMIGGGGDLTDAVAPAVGVLAGAALLGGFHWTVFRADRSVAPTATPVPQRHLLVVGFVESTAIRGANLQAERVLIFRRAGGEVPAGTVDDLKVLVETLPAGGTMLLQDPSGSWEALPLVE